MVGYGALESSKLCALTDDAFFAAFALASSDVAAKSPAAPSPSAASAETGALAQAKSTAISAASTTAGNAALFPDSAAQQTEPFMPSPFSPINDVAILACVRYASSNVSLIGRMNRENVADDMI